MSLSKILLPRWSAIALLGSLLLVSGPALAVTVQPGVQVGTISQLPEVSGLVVSRSMANTLWVHNDSGDTARFFAIAKTGGVLGTITLDGATAADWEDIAIGPKPGGGNYLYLGDIGDNAEARVNGVTIYRVTEPTTSADATITAANYTKVTLKYSDGVPHNAESLMVDPISGDLLIVTKATTGQVFRAPNTIFNTPNTVGQLAYLGNLNVTLPRATAADISPDGLHILIRNTGTTAYLYERTPGQSVWDALQGTAIAVTLKAELQGEAIGWAADGSGFYTTSELAGLGPRPIWFYAFSVPEPSSMVIMGFGLGSLTLWRGLARLRRRAAA